MPLPRRSCSSNSTCPSGQICAGLDKTCQLTCNTDTCKDMNGCPYGQDCRAGICEVKISCPVKLCKEVRIRL